MTTGWSGFFFCRSRSAATSCAFETARSSARPLSRSRSISDWSRRTMTSSGVAGGCADLPTVGRSITPGFTSGAVTMKMTSSTIITSTYGTMLIWFIRRRARIALGPAGLVVGRGGEPRLRLALEDIGELLHEALEAHREPVDVVREAVVGHHRGYRREEADRRGDQRLRDPRGDRGESRLRDVRQAAEGVHDAPHGAEQPHVGAHRAHRREEGEVRFQPVHLALIRRPHRAPSAVDHEAGVGSAALALELRELAEPGFEDALQTSRRVPVVDRALVQRREVGAAP